ncbi:MULTISPECIES: hypothetical protein [Pyrobaculum]|uniref:Uncharacterized protein n=2 Tax=Pyrobaculum arsenaticum TaxID=121277 RepID=A4WJA0_PYRAR|nr:hypothetical protein [Pyrobaculum arsenaticum]ABP50467.1 hypothetical protein Pars_0882 [Pyrobaculum arsenaticum DSM 13514]MCY0890459.1 hypothetical protein [Pyrobaculum arsenaticum]NYR14592.1 hypothetical protein [Pyrobaculum arsenaticum]
MYEVIVKFVETGDYAYLEQAAREALRSGAYLEHVLDLILLTPAEELPPSAKRLAAGVKRVVKSADCGALPPRLVVPCEIAKRRLGLIEVDEEEVPEVEALGVARVVYAFCKAVGVIVQ